MKSEGGKSLRAGATTKKLYRMTVRKFEGRPPGRYCELTICYVYLMIIHFEARRISHVFHLLQRIGDSRQYARALFLLPENIFLNIFLESYFYINSGSLRISCKKL